MKRLSKLRQRSIVSVGMVVFVLCGASLFGNFAPLADATSYTGYWFGASAAERDFAPGTFKLSVAAMGGAASGYLSFQTDGNLVAYYNGKAQWASNTNGEVYAGGYLALQKDGHIVIYNEKNSGYQGAFYVAKRALWYSSTYYTNTAGISDFDLCVTTTHKVGDPASKSFLYTYEEEELTNGSTKIIWSDPAGMTIPAKEQC